MSQVQNQYSEGVNAGIGIMKEKIQATINTRITELIELNKVLHKLDVDKHLDNEKTVEITGNDYRIYELKKLKEIFEQK